MAPIVLQWINVDNPTQGQSEKDREIIRSHAARYEDDSIVENRRRRIRYPIRKLRHAKLQSPRDKLTTLHQPSFRPKLPIESRPYIRFLLHHFLCFTSSESCQDQESLGPQILPLGLQDAQLLHAILSISATHHAALQPRHGPQNTNVASFYHHGQALKILDDRLSSSNTKEVTDDTTVTTIILLAIYSLYFNDLTANRAHAIGLENIVALRGGADKLGMNGLLYQLVNWIRLTQAIRMLPVEGHEFPGFKEFRLRPDADAESGLKFLAGLADFWAASRKLHENAKLKSRKSYPQDFGKVCAAIEMEFERVTLNYASGEFSSEDSWRLVSLVLAFSGPLNLNLMGRVPDL